MEIDHNTVNVVALATKLGLKSKFVDRRIAKAERPLYKVSNLYSIDQDTMACFDAMKSIM